MPSVDREKFEKILTDRREAMAEYMDNQCAVGVKARAIDVLDAWDRWLRDEIERGTPVPVLLDAVEDMLGNITASFIYPVSDTPLPVAVQFLRNVALVTMQRLHMGFEGGTVPVQRETMQ